MIDGNYKYWRIDDHKPSHIDENIDICNFEVMERIGSPSTAGLVYNIKVGNHHFALKIMPILDKYNIEDNEREIAFAQLFSNMYTEGICPYFLYVVSSGYCPNFIYGPEEKVYKKLSMEYSGNTQVNYLISELGIMDLNSWINKYDEEMVMIFMRDTIEGIICMQSQNVMHGDLHIFNVLIVDRKESNRLIACIHDFGRSNYIISPYQYYLDYKIFLESLRNKLYKSELKDKVSIMYNNMPEDFKSVNNPKDFMKYILSKYFN